MTSHRTDSALVAAHLGGDHAALGAISDHYAYRLFDTAAAMLRDRDEAADAVQEVFLVAAQKLDQLRDPDRLKPWLFAVLRNEVYLRTRRRSRSRPTDFTGTGVEMEAPTDPRAEGGDVERQELAELVRAAAAGLDERDQLVMELNVRQGLSGADLAAAIGVTTSQAHVLVHRMRDRFSRSLGAFTVARMGREDCDELRSILEGWDGTFSVLVRKRVARHVERCAVCDETRSRFGAAALFGSAPVLAAPADLRDAVLARASRGTAPRHEHHLDGDGFPRPPRTARLVGLAGSRLGVAAAVLVVLAVVAGMLAVLGGDSDPSTDLLAAGDTTSTVESPGTASGPGTSSGPGTGTGTSADPSTSAADPSVTTSTTSSPSTVTSTSTGPGAPAPTPGDVVLSTSVVDLGESATSGRLLLTNPGGTPVSWTLDGAGGPFTWAARSGTIPPGGSATLQVSIDRSGLPEGSVSSPFTVAGSPAGPAPVQVRARVERPPQVAIVRGPRSLSCPSSTTGFVVADITDESPIASVELRWSGPGNPGSTSMVRSSSTAWEGTVAPDHVDGTWTYTVVATDSRGNRASASRSLVMSGCSGAPGGFATP